MVRNSAAVSVQCSGCVSEHPDESQRCHAKHTIETALAAEQVLQYRRNGGIGEAVRAIEGQRILGEVSKAE